MLYEFDEPACPEELLKDLIKELVSAPEEVEVYRMDTPQSTVLTIDVVSEDKGKIIGRSGSIIQSINTIFRALGGKRGRTIWVEIQD